MDALEVADHGVIGSRWTCKGCDTDVRDVLAFDEANTSQLWESGELLDTCIGQAVTASQIDIANAIARLDQLDHGTV